MFNPILTKFNLPKEIAGILDHQDVLVPESREQLVKLAIEGSRAVSMKSHIESLIRAGLWKQLSPGAKTAFWSIFPSRTCAGAIPTAW